MKISWVCILALLLSVSHGSSLIHEGVDRVSVRLNSFVPSQFLGGGVAGFVGNENYTLTAGYADTAKTKPFTEKTIIRIASDTKLVGTVAFLRLIDKGLITGFEAVKTWIPSFGNATVLQAVENPPTAILANPLKVTTGGNLLIVHEKDHGRKIGDTIAITGSSSVQNIPADIINGIWTIESVPNKNQYTVLLPLVANRSASNEGGVVTIVTLPEGAKKTIWKNVTYYYTTVPLKRDVLIWHILTHTLGYEYVILGEQGGYGDDRKDSETRKTLAAIQAGILMEKLIPMPYPIPFIPGTFNTIQEWTNAMASVPLLFQPGEDWSYGPTLSLLGALIEAIDGRSVEQFVKEEVTGPLSMVDTGFFIQDNDPQRQDKLSRIQDLALNVAPGVFVNVATIPQLEAYADYFYGSNRPRSLPLIASGMYSTLKDRSIFYKMLLNNGRYSTVNGTKYILSPATISLLSHNRINDLVPSVTFPPIKNWKWGLGVAVGAGSDDEYTLAGQTKHSIFWSGLFGSAFNVDWTNDSVYNLALNTFDILQSGKVKVILSNLHYASIDGIKANDDDVSPTKGSSVKLF